MADKEKTLVIIDGKSVFYRGYYAMSYLTVSDGRPVGGVYGFMVLALNLIRRLDPDYLIVAWDKSKTNIASRKKIYEAYKANRQPAPDDFYEQIGTLMDLLNAAAWPVYEIDNYEADDIMATLAKQAEKRGGIRTVLVSSDLDLLQALGPRTDFFAIKKNLKQVERFDPSSFEAKYQIKTDQFIDLKSLMGDSSDNIPGVRGIGPKAAAALLEMYPSLDEIYQNLDSLPNKYRTKLEADREMAFMSRQLVILHHDLPIKLSLTKAAIKVADPPKLINKLRELEFFSLIQQIPDKLIDPKLLNGFPQADIDLKLPEVKQAKLAQIEKLDWSQPALVQAYCCGRFGADPIRLLVSVSGQAWLFEVPAKAPKIKWPPKIKIYGFGTKNTIQTLRRLGANEIVVSDDIKVNAFLLDPTVRQQSLTVLANRELKYNSELDDLSPEDYDLKAPEIVAIIEEIRQKQQAQLKPLSRLKKLLLEVELPFIPVLAKMELVGIKFESKELEALDQELTDKLKKLEQLIYDYAGEEFNIASPSQLAKILYGKLHLSTAGIARASRGSWSTDIRQLKKLRKQHPIIDCLIGWREFSKLQSVYIEGLSKCVDPDGRIRSDFHQTAVVTGRLSSRNPNLQTIPTAKELGRQIRRAFTAPKGRVLVNADYSQFELRLAAVLAGEKQLLKAFAAGEDIHRLTASQIFEIKPDQVDSKQRSLAKIVNFGILYGQGPHGLAEQTNLSYSEAQKFIDDYFRQRPDLREYFEQTVATAREQGYVETLFGRRRPTPDLKSTNSQIAKAAQRQTINFPIQGTEADLMKMAMISLDQQLDPDCQMIIQVHDSILVECPAAKAKAVSRLMQKTMESIWPDLGVKLLVEVKSGSNWAEI